MNGCRILLFQNEEKKKDTKFCFFNISWIDSPLHSYEWPTCPQAQFIWPKPSFALALKPSFVYPLSLVYLAQA